MNPKESLDKLINGLYETFAQYAELGDSFCGYCYSQSELQRIKLTPLRQLNPDDARMLLWEPSDHWENGRVYRHYLPRMLQIMGPPYWVEDLYVEHVFETMLSLGFANWPVDERMAVSKYLAMLVSLINFVWPEDREKFRVQLEAFESHPNTPR